LFDEQGEQIFAATDAIAERARKIGGTTLRSIGQIARMQRVLDNDAGYVTPRDMLAELREDNKPLTSIMRETHGLRDEQDDVATTDNQVQQVELLGKLMLYDKNLSVNRNEACAFCHMPETGFTGPVSELNRTIGSYPGSVRTRFSNRKPQTHAYAPLSPVLHYNPGQG